MPVRWTAADAATKWAANTSGNWAKICRAVKAMTGSSPPQRAAAKQTQWLTAVGLSAQKWADQCSAVTMEAWKGKFDEGHSGMYTASVNAAKTEMSAFYGQLFPFMRDKLAELDNENPRGATIDEQAARAAAWIKKMAQFKKPAGL